MILDEKLNFAWCEVPDPVRKADEVLIKVHAAAERGIHIYCEKPMTVSLEEVDGLLS
jgi:hypothetical protein